MKDGRIPFRPGRSKIRMKKLIGFFLLLTFLLCAGCSRVPPVRIAENEITSISRDIIYTVDTAYEEADLVALIRVGTWLGEAEENYITYFEARTEKIFKGDAPEKIVLIQDGNSGYTIHGYSLFIAGNELLVFLKNADDEAYENAFWIEGSYTTFFDVVRSGKDLYYLDRYGMIGDGVSACDNLFFDAELSAKLYAALEKQDPLAKDRRYHFIYSAEQMDAYLERLKTGE
jgi:hypothetical protein